MSAISVNSNNSKPIASFKENPELVQKVETGIKKAFTQDLSKINLAEALEEARQYWQEQDVMPPEFVEELNRSLTELVQKGLSENSLQVGQKIPEFSLPNALGKNIDVKALLARGALVITFYRGGWCPYCNLALRALEQHLPEIQALGANLIAITPEQPDSSLSTLEKNQLEFEVLSDSNNEVAEALGIVWKLPEETLRWHEEFFELFLANFNGGNRDELPVPATFIVDTDGQIIWRFVEAQYWHRAEPSDIVKVLRDRAEGI